MIHFRTRKSNDDVEAAASPPDNDEFDKLNAGFGKQILLDDLVKFSDKPDDINGGILTIDASSTPAGIP